MTLHATIAAFGAQCGALTVGGRPIDRLANQVGSTPFFAYDRRLLSDRIAILRAALPAGLHLHYAIKANPMPAVVQHLAGLMDGFDVASANEMQVALDTAMPASEISFAGPGKTDAELARAIAAGITIELESFGEARRAIAIGDAQGVAPRLAIRVNPDFQVRGSGMRMGGGAQQFGVDSEAVPELLAELATNDVEFVGFHIFAGSQNLNADTLAEAQRKTVALALSLAEISPLPVRSINIGGGLGIPYFPADQALDLHRIGDNLAELLESQLRPHLPHTKVVLEMGRYIVGECGVYVTRVVDRKQSRGRTYLVVDGGLHHQLAASGNFGQTIRRNYPLAVANRLADEPVEQVTVVGCLCTPLDLLGDDVFLPHAEPGDLIAIFHAGAYGLTASPTAFLGHSPPAEILV